MDEDEARDDVQDLEGDGDDVTEGLLAGTDGLRHIADMVDCEAGRRGGRGRGRGRAASAGGPPARGVGQLRGQDARGPREALRRVMRSPVFHVKAAAWIIWALCYLCVRGPTELSYMRVNRALDRALPVLNSALRRMLPASLGDCDADSAAPTPCVGDRPLFAARLNASAPSLAPRPDVLVRWAIGRTQKGGLVNLQLICFPEVPLDAHKLVADHCPEQEGIFVYEGNRGEG